MKRFIQINDIDNVAVVLDDEGLSKGETITIGNNHITLVSDVQRGHKFALKDINKGDKVIKYGYPIGVATTDIKKGEWIHSHNLQTNLSDNLEYTYNPTTTHIAFSNEKVTFNGYLRRNGDAGIRNELWIIPTVGCVNGPANAIVDRIKQECDLEGIDDVRAFTHNYGCSQLGDDLVNTRNALAALAKHPNAGGVLILSLGCENNKIDMFKEALGDYDENRIRFLVAQHVDDEIAQGFEICSELIALMHTDKRCEMPVSKLRVGLKCGGSDGLSGITANPLVGLFSDWLITHGGTTVLTEVPEMFGAETILMDRAINQEVFDSTVSLINNFKDYFRSYNQPIYENPSPGNKEGGITTLEEKSLGCVQKGGAMPVVDVLDYAQQLTKNGLNLLKSPGNDLVASTALALSGCQMILFTTGRGTPFGTSIPTMKISTNSILSAKKHSWIDFDAGTIVDNESLPEVLTRLINKVIATANNDKLNHEISGTKEIAIFKTGVTL